MEINRIAYFFVFFFFDFLKQFRSLSNRIQPDLDKLVSSLMILSLFRSGIECGLKFDKSA